MNDINQIRKMFEQLIEEVESLREEVEDLRDENRELKLFRAKYESITEPDIDGAVEMSSNLSKEELYALGESIINHTAQDETLAIRKLMYCWANNATRSKMPGEIARGIITSNSLSEKNLNVIYSFIVVAVKEKYTSRLGKPESIPQKYLNLIQCLLDNGKVRSEMREILLDIVFDHTRVKRGWSNEWATFFKSTPRYKVVKSRYYTHLWDIEKK